MAGAGFTPCLPSSGDRVISSRLRLSSRAERESNQLLQQTAAAILVFESSLSLSAAAAAELVRSQGDRVLDRQFVHAPILASAAISLCMGLPGCGSNTPTANAVKTGGGTTAKPAADGGQDAKPGDMQEEVKRLKGLWLLSRQEDRDTSLAIHGLTEGLQFEQDKVRDVRGIKGRVMGQGTSGSYKLDLSKNPKTIDIRWEEGGKKGVTQQGIYKLENGTLTISWRAQGDKERPREFNRHKAQIKYYARSDQGQKE
jgi:uncharacterized protein (TIGR03067 family)